MPKKFQILFFYQWIFVLSNCNHWYSLTNVMIYGIVMITMLKKISTFKAENQVWNKHAEAQLKKGRAYKEKNVYSQIKHSFRIFWNETSETAWCSFPVPCIMGLMSLLSEKNDKWAEQYQRSLGTQTSCLKALS